MKRNDLIRHLSYYSCQLYREGAKHSVFINLNNNLKSSIPRLNELKNNTCKEICKQLEIPYPNIK